MNKVKHSLLRFLDILAAKPRIAMGIVFALSCGIRLGLLVLYLHTGNLLHSGEAENIARSLVKTGEFASPFAIPTGPTAHCAPVYPSIAAVVYGIFGMGTRGELARCVLSILVFSFLYSLFPWIATRFGLDFRAGLLAGIFTALVPTRRSMEVLGAWETPYAAIALAVLLSWTLLLWRKPSVEWGVAWLWGMAWGAAALVHTSLFAVFMALCGTFLLTARRQRSLRLVVVAITGCCLVLLPWTLRNRSALGAWILIRSNLGIELETGNHDGAHPDAEQNTGDRVHPFSNPARAAELRRLGEVEYNRQALRRALSWMRQHPAAFLSLTAQKCFRFWFSTPIHLVEFSITFPLTLFALWSVVRLARIYPETIALWCVAFVSFSLIYYVTQYSARYRAVVEWMLLIAAGQVFLQWLRGYKDRREILAPERTDLQPANARS